MPVHKVKIKGKTGYRWGSSSKVYTGPGAKEKAARQGRAAFAHGYRSERLPVPLDVAMREQGYDVRITNIPGRYVEEIRKVSEEGFDVEIYLTAAYFSGWATVPKKETVVGRLLVRKVADMWPSGCNDEIAMLRNQWGENLGLMSVRVAEIPDSSYQRRGLGLLLYVTAVIEARRRGCLLIANACESGGSTSWDAQRVWKSVRFLEAAHVQGLVAYAKDGAFDPTDPNVVQPERAAFARGRSGSERLPIEETRVVRMRDLPFATKQGLTVAFTDALGTNEFFDEVYQVVGSADVFVSVVSMSVEDLPAVRPSVPARVIEYASLETPFPPIVLVAGEVVDGAHRLASARARHDSCIDVIVFADWDAVQAAFPRGYLGERLPVGGAPPGSGWKETRDYLVKRVFSSDHHAWSDAIDAADSTRVKIEADSFIRFVRRAKSAFEREARGEYETEPVAFFKKSGFDLHMALQTHALLEAPGGVEMLMDVIAESQPPASPEVPTEASPEVPTEASPEVLSAGVPFVSSGAAPRELGHSTIESWRKALKRLTAFYRTLADTDEDWKQGKTAFSTFFKGYYQWVLSFLTTDTSSPEWPKALIKEAWLVYVFPIHEMFPLTYDYKAQTHVPAPWLLSKNRDAAIRKYQKVFNASLSALEVWISRLGEESRTFPPDIETTRVGPVSVAITGRNRREWEADVDNLLRHRLPQTVRSIERAGFPHALDGLTILVRFDIPSGMVAGVYRPVGYHEYRHDEDPARDDIIVLSLLGINDPGTLIHEIGHRFYFRGLSINARAAWVEATEALYEPLTRDDIRWAVDALWSGEWSPGKEDVRRLALTLPAGEAGAHRRAVLTFLYDHLISFTRDLDKVRAFYFEEIAEAEARTGRELERNSGRAFVPVTESWISEYGTTNPVELFAETFKSWVLHGEGSIPPALRRIFRDTLRSVPERERLPVQIERLL